MSLLWETSSAASARTPVAPVTAPAGSAWGLRSKAGALAARGGRLELVGLITLAAILDLWALSRNGWANDYYSAAVRSMSTSWHDFLFASFDKSGVMTVDKPPLALWVQALSVRVFGYHPLSVLVPEALMGVASVVLVYDMVARRFGRLGGSIAGLALALTPITVAVSRHNNPDALVVLCSVAALWFAVRALDPEPVPHRTRKLVLAGVCVGLGFETKMGVALTVVPGIALAWMWVAPAGRGRLHALRQLLAGGSAMALVGGAWPALVELTPASQRPWVSGTSKNTVLSLIFEYNGLGRVEGQAGGPGGAGGGGVFGEATGALRLIDASLGGQAGWLLGFAVVAGLAIALSCRLRSADPRSGWIVAVGGAFLATAGLFSFAAGIFHPYYVSLLAPFAAALFGAGAAQLIERGLLARLLAPLAVAAGVLVELVIAGHYPGQLSWLAPVLIGVGALTAAGLLGLRSARARTALLGAAVGGLLIAPAVWAFDTLGYATSGTFPSGGPASEGIGGPGPFGGGGGPARGGFGALRGGPGGPGPALFGRAGGAGSGGPGAGRPPVGGFAGPGGPGGGPPGFGGGPPFGGPPFGGGPFGGGQGSLNPALAYVAAHGGGTIALSSQSSAASAIIAKGANVAGIGGFSGRESEVSVSWLARAVSAGQIRWVLGEQGGFGGGPSSDSRPGAKDAMSAVARSCRAITLPSTSAAGAGGEPGGGGTLYDCRGRAAQLASGATGALAPQSTS